MDREVHRTARAEIWKEKLLLAALTKTASVSQFARRFSAGGRNERARFPSVFSILPKGPLKTRRLSIVTTYCPPASLTLRASPTCGPLWRDGDNSGGTNRKARAVVGSGLVDFGFWVCSGKTVDAA